MKYKDYKGGLDRKFFTAHDVKVVQYQPWQYGLFHPDLKGKFVWYPQKGTLMFEHKEEDLLYKMGEHKNSEDVYKIIMGKIGEQQNS